MSSALLLFPDFALILLWFFLRRGMGLGDPFWAGLEKLIYFVLFPSLLFSAIVRTHIDFAATAPFVACGFVALFGGLLMGLPSRWLFAQSPKVFASHIQCAFRFNSYIGLAVVGKVFGPPGIAALGILLGALVPLANMSAVALLARHGDAPIWREFLRNPLIVATSSGLLLNLMGFHLPEPLTHFLGRLSDAAVATGLLAVGAALRLSGANLNLKAATYITAVKLLAVPALTWVCARQLGLSDAYFQVAVIFAALPTASSAYILTVRMGGDGQGVAWLISASTLASMVTLTAWLALLGAGVR